MSGLYAASPPQPRPPGFSGLSASIPQPVSNHTLFNIYRIYSNAKIYRSAISKSFSYYQLIPYLCGSKKLPKEVYTMLIIDSKDCENIDKALKKYKKKFEKSRVLLELRERQSFTKPSVRRRTQVLKAVYKQNIASGKIDI
ncbi:30S ribosomal protein S21 [Ferruginibacter albus]|uniref:30S ribosomal protein S21 n=1 Tax=Ferruginibacter albus TaxID=2875540 RepID=UPI001CC62370